MLDLRLKENRMKLIQDMDTENTKARKQWSLRSSEVQGGRIQQYVIESLQSQFSPESVKEMPIVSSINIQKSIVDKKATIYKKPADRTYTELSEEQEEIMKLINRDMMLDEKLNFSNKNYCYQDQSIGMIIPKGGKYICRIFKMHQIDAIVDYEDPESAAGYLISAFDRTDYIQRYQDKHEIDTATGIRPRSTRSSANEVESDSSDLADDYQYRKYTMKFIVWTKDYNFMMNGLGEVIDPETGEESSEVDISSPLADQGIMPFFEVSKDKDFEYFVRPSNTLTDFTVQFNVALSDLQNNCKLNGYSVGVLKGPSSMHPQNLVIGPAMLLKLSTDDMDKEVDFSFANPSSNIGDISNAVDKLLNYFTTSEGLGGEVINSQGSTQSYSSGLDRFIAMINRVEAHSDDYDKYRNVEKKIFNIIKAWNNVLSGSESLDRKYQLGTVSEKADIEVNYHRPEMIQTDSERLNVLSTEKDLGIRSKLEMIMERRNIDDEDKAREILEKIEEEKMQFMPVNTMLPSEEEEDSQEEDTQEEDN